uniref:Uncharacterized protein n=1 Tax=Auxenochlorella protothecoides TaxID=3075 RepID=A0A1D1ZYJ5_AUXPR
MAPASICHSFGAQKHDDTGHEPAQAGLPTCPGLHPHSALEPPINPFHPPTQNPSRASAHRPQIRSTSASCRAGGPGHPSAPERPHALGAHLHLRGGRHPGCRGGPALAHPRHDQERRHRAPGARGEQPAHALLGPEPRDHLRHLGWPGGRAVHGACGVGGGGHAGCALRAHRQARRRGLHHLPPAPDGGPLGRRHRRAAGRRGARPGRRPAGHRQPRPRGPGRLRLRGTVVPGPFPRPRSPPATGRAGGRCGGVGSRRAAAGAGSWRRRHAARRGPGGPGPGPPARRLRLCGAPLGAPRRRRAAGQRCGGGPRRGGRAGGGAARAAGRRGRVEGRRARAAPGRHAELERGRAGRRQRHHRQLRRGRQPGGDRAVRAGRAQQRTRRCPPAPRQGPELRAPVCAPHEPHREALRPAPGGLRCRPPRGGRGGCGGRRRRGRHRVQQPQRHQQSEGLQRGLLSALCMAGRLRGHMEILGFARLGEGSHFPQQALPRFFVSFPPTCTIFLAMTTPGEGRLPFLPPPGAACTIGATPSSQRTDQTHAHC